MKDTSIFKGVIEYRNSRGEDVRYVQRERGVYVKRGDNYIREQTLPLNFRGSSPASIEAARH